MGIRSSLQALISGPDHPKAWGAEFVAAQKQLSLGDDDPTENFRRAMVGRRQTIYRRPTVRQALGVPAIHRAVALISSTTGMLSVQGYRNGDLMPDPPPLLSRPDPYHTPATFYGTTAAQMAKYGEFVWYIASRDGDGRPSALVNVPLHELRVEDNPANRLFPSYRWGSFRGTRYSAANSEGKFVHQMYTMNEPFALRGEGPLQLCNAASSVAVEAQAWAANFYGEGGHPSVLIRVAGQLGTYADGFEALDPEQQREAAETEAEALRRQWVDRPNNVPRVVDDLIKDVDYKEPNPQGAQMLEARNNQVGDAARMFGISGSLLEFHHAGSSLTYQNLADEFTKFVKTCLQPLYLEPIEQELSDLLPRSTVGRFNVKGFLRADPKTRFQVYEIAIANGIYDVAYAQREEGILPGDVEFAPVPFSPPAAIPARLPAQVALSDQVRCGSCNKMVAKALGPGSELDCPRCKAVIRVA